MICYRALHAIQHTHTPHLHTVVTDAAVGTTRGSVELAAVTPLHLDLHTIDGDDPVQRMSAVILLICGLWRGGGEWGGGGGGEGRGRETHPHRSWSSRNPSIPIPW